MNRAQKRAMEIRTAETLSAARTIEPAMVESGQRPVQRGTQSRRRSAATTAPKPALLSRAQEYAFIRSDFRRLLLTAGSLLAVMLVLLVVIE